MVRVCLCVCIGGGGVDAENKAGEAAPPLNPQVKDRKERVLHSSPR